MFTFENTDTVQTRTNTAFAKYFHAGTGQLNDDGHIEGAALWTKVVSWYIICFPAMDVVSAFPLNAITVANNMFGAYYGKRIHEFEVCSLFLLSLSHLFCIE